MLEGAVGRGVVDHDDLERAELLLFETTQHLDEHLAAVPVRNHDADARDAPVAALDHRRRIALPLASARSYGACVPASKRRQMLQSGRICRPVERANRRFTAHNVRLPDGTETLPGVPPLEDGPVYRAVFRSLLELCPPVAADGTRARAVDLGALEGGWSVLLARAGYETLGIEGRTNNLALCEYVRASCGLPWLSFVQDDVRNLARHGTFDVCFCSGLLYHLDTPSAFLRLVAAQTSRVLVLHTHYAPDTLDGSKWARNLSDWDEHEGRRGRWFTEWPEGSSSDEVESYRWASLENPRSFWLRKGDLLQAIADAGFPMVYEQHDFVGDMAGSTYQSDEHRSLFVCVKPRLAGHDLAVVTTDGCAAPRLHPPASRKEPRLARCERARRLALAVISTAARGASGGCCRSESAIG